MDAISKRRSVRKYTDQGVSDELIKKILSAAMSAPSAGNEQPWHFIVVKNKGMLKDLSNCSPYSKAVCAAPVGIVVCGDLSVEVHKGHWVQDCSAAVENMLIEATSLDLGAVWLGVYPLEDRIYYIKKLFNLPETIIPFAIIPVGYPCAEHNPVDRFQIKRIHNEQW